MLEALNMFQLETKTHILSFFSSGRFEAAQPEPEPSQSLVCQQSLPPGSPSRCVAGGQTTGPDERAVDSHVQSSSPAGRSSGRGTKGNRGSPAGDRMGGMNNLDDYSSPKPRKKAPLRTSESPMLSPDTLDALEKAETLVKEAQKTILEASYDVASSPEREKSIGSARDKETEDEDAIYIRDIVATRFYEANESARIFTRPSTRPLADRLCRPMVRNQRRSRRARERSLKMCSDDSTTSQSKSLPMPVTNARRNAEIYSKLRGEPKKRAPQRLITDEEIPARMLKNAFPAGRVIANENVTNSLTVQTGPPVDIRNELTITSVEKVNISPCSSLPVQRNIKTYEFRHESCVNAVSSSSDNAAPRSIQPITGGDNTAAAGDSLRGPEKSRVSITKSHDTASQQGSRSDLAENKSGRSIPPEPLEGHADNVPTRSADRGKHVPKENKGNEGNKDEIGNIEYPRECFMDFLRRSGHSGQDKNESLRRQVFQRIDTNDKINIFDRAVDQFLEDFRQEERQANVELGSKQLQETSLSGNNVPENLVKDTDEGGEHLIGEEFSGTEYFDEDWDAEDINLQPPNLVHLEKILQKADSTMDKVLRGTKSLTVLMSEYSIEPEIRPGLINQHFSYNPALFYSIAAKDISSDLESRHINHVDERAPNGSENCGERDAITSSEYSIKTSENINEISDTSHYCTKTKREVAKKLSMEIESSRKLNEHPRFSTPLNNDWKIGKNCKTSCKPDEFARFLIGLQQPGESAEAIGLLAFPGIDNRDKDALNRNEFVPASTTLARNGLRKQIILDEINRKCYVDSSLDRDRSSRAEEDQKTQETHTFPNYPTRDRKGSADVGNSGTRSLIQDSAIGRATDQSDRISVGTKLIDEYIARIDSSRSGRCAPPERDSSRSKRSITERDDNDNVESLKTKTFTMKNNGIKNSRELDKCEKKIPTSLRTETLHPANSLCKNKSLVKDNDELSDKNQPAGSAGSSLKDRTSFDISTAYSEDFEEPVTSTKKSITREKSSVELKSTPSCLKIAEPEKSLEDDKKDATKSELTSSLQSTELRKLHNESKEERPFLDKSMSISVSKSSDKIQQDNKGNESFFVEPAMEEKGTVECNSEIKEVAVIQPEVAEKRCRDERSIVSTSGSAKGSATSSISGESRRGEIKRHNESNNDAVSGNFAPGNNLIARSDEIFDKSGCKESTNYVIGEPNEALESSTSTIGTVYNDSLENYEKNNPSLNKEAQKPNKSPNEFDLSPGELDLASCRILKDFAIFESSVEFHSTPKHLIPSESIELNCPKLHDRKMSGKNYPGDENEKNTRIGNTNSDINKRCSTLTSNLEEITNLPSSIMIDLTPKHLIENSRYTSEEAFSPAPDPIPNDDHVTTAADTCSENYSEGELYLPSSCSYSLGEIRVSERGPYGTAAATVIQSSSSSSARNADGMKIYLGKKHSTRNSDNTVKETNFKSPVLSPGEVQETDVESISSSRGVLSDVEKQMGLCG